MADNVAITAGSGTTIATDDVGGVHYQYVKLDLGASGAASPASGSIPVQGEVAHDAVDSGSPLGIGGIARTANPTAVTALDRVKAWFDKVGKLVAVPYGPRDLVSSQTTSIANTTETTIVTAVASTYLDLLSITITNATATAVVASLRDTTAGTTRAQFALAANGGVAVIFPGTLPQTTVNTNWTLQLGTGSITVYILATFVKNV